MFESSERNFGLKLAKSSILSGFGKEEEISLEEIPESYKEQKASFVTLKKYGWELRGCIGSILPNTELWKDIQKNAYNSAFQDFRFPPLTMEEIQNDKDFTISISVLTSPVEKKFSNVDEMLNYLEENKPGLIIKKGAFTATFLPAVWEDLTDPQDFLNHLVAKAGEDSNYFWLEFDKWNYFEYYTEEFSGNWHEIS